MKQNHRHTNIFIKAFISLFIYLKRNYLQFFSSYTDFKKMKLIKKINKFLNK